jgi:error-prone DNA polymerase
MAAVRARRSLDELDGWLPPAATAHLRSGEEMAALFARFPEAVAQAASYGRECSFDLQLVVPKLPPFPVPDGHSAASWLRKLTYEGALGRYGPPERESAKRAYAQLAHELKIIEELDFPGYFLIVHDIVNFCRKADIFCQGRGSAANSAVCFALGITNVDAVGYELLFERFLAPERDGPPDIDLDIESDRREEVIQYVYGRYSRECAAQVANVITYRPRSAIRDLARAFGFSPGQQDAWSKQVEHWGPLAAADDHDIPQSVLELAEEIQGFPRHLSIHSGGMVLCDRPVIEVCPVEWARMPGRTVLQWDKDDCAVAGLVKFDLLGLGMLSALHYATDLIRDHHGVEIDLAMLPKDDPAVYDMMCAADTVGVFQIESRAQMATLPRMRPRKFYDLVVEVALIRPGPIQGGSVHPYLRRHHGLESDDPPHPLLYEALKRTRGVPLFQEQLMQIVVDIAGFTPAEADQLRRAMGSKRSGERMAKLRARLYEGMSARGVTEAVADDIYQKLLAFSSFGFPESHAVSFALLVYASAWLKHYYPAAFCAALLRAQPMGFYSPQSLVADARRHGVVVRGPDLNASDAMPRLEPVCSEQCVETGAGPERKTGAGPERKTGAGPERKTGAGPERKTGAGPERKTGAGPEQAVRLGLAAIRQVGTALAERIEAERRENGPYPDLTTMAQRVRLTSSQAEALATAGAFGCFGLARREALWAAGVAARERPDRLAGTATGGRAPYLPGMSEVERSVADVWATGISPGSYPTQYVRDELDARGVLTSAVLGSARHGARVWVGGVVTHRQRPSTAGGVTFVSLEDETGTVNVICSPGVWTRYRRVARSAAALLVLGRLERVEGVTNVIAVRLEQLPLPVPSTSRDFR